MPHALLSGSAADLGNNELQADNTLLCNMELAVLNMSLLQQLGALSVGCSARGVPPP